MAVCVGCGLNVDANGVLNVDLADDTAGDGHSGLHCDNTNGLSLQIQHANTDSLILSGNGTNASQLSGTISVDEQNSTTISWTPGREGTAALPIQAQVIVSGDLCNGIVARGSGLYAPCPDSYACNMIQGICGPFVPFGISPAGAGNFNLEACCADNACTNCVGSRWQVCNPSPCCTMEGFISVIAYGGQINAASVGFSAEAHIEVQYNGGGFGPAQPNTIVRMHNVGTVPTVYDPSNMEERNYLILGPGECIDFQARVSINVFAGTATWAVGPEFEYYIHMTQMNCGCAG